MRIGKEKNGRSKKEIRENRMKINRKGGRGRNKKQK